MKEERLKAGRQETVNVMKSRKNEARAEGSKRHGGQMKALQAHTDPGTRLLAEEQKTAHCAEREVAWKSWYFTDSKESILGRKGYQHIKCLRVYKYSDNIVTLGRVLTTQNKWNTKF